MERQEVLDSVLAAIRKYVRLKPDFELTEATNLADNLAVDSLDLFGIGNEIQTSLEINLTISEENSLGNMTIAGIVDFLMTKLDQSV